MHTTTAPALAQAFIAALRAQCSADTFSRLLAGRVRLAAVCDAHALLVREFEALLGHPCSAPGVNPAEDAVWADAVCLLRQQYPAIYAA